MNEHAGDILSSSPVRASAPTLEQPRESEPQDLLATGGLLGAVASASCCIVPLVLFSLGASGAWIGQLSALYPYKEYIFLVTVAFLVGGFYRAYRRTPASVCGPDGSCRLPVSDRLNKAALWSATVLVLAAMAFPYVAPAFLES